ncbi:von Willebrand factor A domain-containing protein 3B-like [Engraulis encrasicolus]|uniref:von Willebrand factor A domain-containing protein 3B-like n=1 Tax=Engraulis encrasicolus TaxID=184585 RepID=UPI002FD2EF6C
MCPEDGRGAVSSQDHDLNALISSAEWLRWYGLKQSKLRLSQILANISFKHTEEYVHSLRKIVSSQYACGMFPQFTIHGAFYNLTASQHELKEICTILENKAELYQQRLAWLTTDSRQLFGAEAVYLFAIGDFGDDITNILSKRPVGNVCPVHTVSFNAKLEKTILALKQLSFVTAGRFHAFAEISVFVDELRDSSQNKAECEVPEFPTKLVGGMPPGCGVREDVYLVWAEKAEALQTRDQIQAMLTELNTANNELGRLCMPCHTLHFSCIMYIMIAFTEPDLWYSCSSDACLDSKQWLEQFGLKAQRLTIYDALASCAFYHSDGIVDIKSMPADENLQSDAETCKKLINAKYCSGFVHMRWKDGSVVHVYVTAEKCRRYEEEMLKAIEAMRRRINWLTEGSRGLFGNIPEQRVYLLLDTSESMRRHLPWLKENISKLLEEQLCQKQRVNMLGFGTHVVPWRDTLTQLSSPALISARHWLDKLQAGGSTNTLGALSLALAAEDTEAVYLLTDGRPDQPAKDILEEVRRGPPVPVHTISFNCDDQEANRFLQELSMETGGRFLHYFTDTQEASGAQGPWENEDHQLLRAEIEEGRRDLESVRRLRAECILLDTFHHGKKETNQKVSRGPEQQSCQGSERDHQFSQRKSPKCTAASDSAAQTKSSLRRLLASGGSIANSIPQGWLLPESLELFQTNADKQMQVLHNLSLTSDENKQKKKRRKVKPKQSLETSTAEWLKANSLAAKKLTLLDAVAPAAIAHNATYVPMLEKHVYSKVFNEVLHLAHISKGGTQQLTLINPLAINLEDYKSRLSKALQDYESRLNMIALRALPQEEKDKFGNEPVGFMERREEVLEVLESLGWPVAQEELSALEEQIRAARDFLQQATELQSVSRKAAQDAQAAIHRSHKDTPPKSHPDAPKRPVDSLRGQKVVAWSEANGAYCYGIARKCVPGKRVKVDFISGTCEVVPLSQVLTVGGSAPCPPLAVADYVLVDIRREDRGEHFVPGVVIATPRRLEAADRFYTILKFNNKEVHTYRNKMIKISQARYQATCGRLAQLRLAWKTK